MPPDIAQAAHNLSRSVAQLAQTTHDYVQGRLDQANQAVVTETRRRLWMMLCAGALLLSLVVGAVFAGLAVVMAFGESARVLAATAVAAVFFLLAATAAWMLRLKWRQRPQILDWIAPISALIAQCRRLAR